MDLSGSDEREPGRVVAGRYRLESVLGRGGMGVVWRAVDTLIERTVALKELRAPGGVAGGEESSFVERALREARNAGRLNHPSIVAVHDVIAPAGDDDAVYIVMEYVEAPSLAEVLDRQGALPAARVAAMGLGILGALEAAHAMGIVHRDIKPGNVLVREGDRVKLTDFGIALAAEDPRLTRSGVMGTHAYLAPECFDAGQVGPAADLWALGATLFHAVAGRAPFERDTTTATLRAILFEDPPSPPCGPPLAELIAGLLTRPVEQRPTSGAARELLERAVATAPTVEEPPPAGTGQPAWQAQPTTLHRSPATPPPGPPPPQPRPQTTQPGGPPSPYVTAQTTQPPTLPRGQSGPGSPYPGGGPGLPRQPAPPTGPMHGASPPGPPPRRNNTPLILGVVAASAALLLIVVLASSGGSDSDGDGGSAAAENVAAGENPVTEENPAVTDGQALAQEFLDAVMGGEPDAAIAMLCPVGDKQHDIDAITDVAGDAALEIDPGTAEIVDEVIYSVDLTGSVHGESISYGAVSAAFEDNCIAFFSAITS